MDLTPAEMTATGVRPSSVRSALTSMARQTPTVQRYNLYRNAVQATVCEKSRLKDSGRADLHFGSTCDAHWFTFRQWFTGYEKEMGGTSHKTPLPKNKSMSLLFSTPRWTPPMHKHCQLLNACNLTILFTHTSHWVLWRRRAVHVACRIVILTLAQLSKC